MGTQYYVYIMTNKRNTVLYTGVTNDLKRRVYEHKGKLVDGFTKKYNITKLVYYEIFQDPENAIMREKQIKAGSRQKKIDLINQMNREWQDLYEQLWEIASPSARNDNEGWLPCSAQSFGSQWHSPVILRLVLNEVKERDEESRTVRGLEGQIASPSARNDNEGWLPCSAQSFGSQWRKKEAGNDQKKEHSSLHWYY